MRTLKTFVAALALICAVQSMSIAETKRIKFRNVTGEHANALRIEFNTEVGLLASLTEPLYALPMVEGNGTSTLILTRGGGSGIADGETLEVTVDGLEAPLVISARWSRENSPAPSDDSWIGETLSQKLTHVAFQDGVATGDGRLTIELDGVVASFEFMAGEPNAVAAARFATLIGGLEYTTLIGIKGSDVLVVADAIGDDVGLVVTADPADSGIDVLVFVEDTARKFLRGDVNGDGYVSSLIDPIYLLRWGFVLGEDPPCMRAADIDGNDEVNAIVDALHLLQFRFGEGPPPPAPGTEVCGTDPASPLSCDTPLDDCE